MNGAPDGLRLRSRAAPPRPVQHLERRRGTSWPRRCILAGIVAMIAVSVALLAMPERFGAGFRALTRTTPDRAMLLSLAAELKAAWNPAERDKVVERARAQAPQLAPALHWLLAQPTHRCIAEAVTLAGELRIASVRDDLMQLAGDKKLRRAALEAADCIEPLSPSELTPLFDGPDRDLLLAAVTIAGRRPVRPVAELLSALRQPDAEVRQAALAALPAQLPTELEPMVAALAADAQAEVAAAGMLALARLPFTAATESLLVDALARPEPSLATAAGTALGGKGARLLPETEQRLWALIGSGPGRSTTALAFLALERTQSIDVQTVQQRSYALDAFGRYFAARLLLRAGRPEGSQQLFDVLGELGRDNRQLRFACLTLLAAIAHMHVSAGEDELRAWFLQHPIDAEQVLPAPPLDL